MDFPVERLTVTAGQVAAMFGLSKKTFQNKLRELTDSHNFPQKLPGSKDWSRPVVEDWFNRNGKPGELSGPAGRPDPLALRQEARHG